MNSLKPNTTAYLKTAKIQRRNKHTINQYYLILIYLSLVYLISVVSALSSSPVIKTWVPDSREWFRCVGINPGWRMELGWAVSSQLLPRVTRASGRIHLKVTHLVIRSFTSTRYSSLSCSTQEHLVHVKHGMSSEHMYSLCGTWWRLGWDDDFQPEGRGFDSRSSRHVGTLGKFFTCSCLCTSPWNSDTVFVL